ncbi:TIGR04219 family outer membrane beta-barrel protein [Aliidiomarina indica]|uniref:TIGR04219 family outer membrane beta-barrel protein n=1 Tax=Aliidiomarina indica TaxID=2749147 RepID=UPI00188E6991|nr:TIGR04219 family outer membrane beta-barrel protein [Aliidiomarina indica]
MALSQHLRQVAFVSLGCLVLSSAAQADIFTLEAEAQYWHANGKGADSLNFPDVELAQTTWDRNGQTRFTASLQHFVPLLPNFRFDTQTLDFTGTTEDAMPQRLDLGHETFTAFYAPLDNELTRIHFGVSVKRVRGFIERNSEGGVTLREAIDADIPMLYLRAETGLPFTGLSIHGQGQFFAFDDNKVQDIEVGIRYHLIDTMMLDGYLSAGYRTVNFEIDEGERLQADYDFRGPFVSFNLRF